MQGVSSSHPGDGRRLRDGMIAATAMTESQRPADLLRELAGHDDVALRRIVAPVPPPDPVGPRCVQPLDRRTRLLVQLAALLACGASAQSLRWAVELAGASGADDEALAAVLVAIGPAVGSVQLVASAPRLAQALGVEPGNR